MQLRRLSDFGRGVGLKIYKTSGFEVSVASKVEVREGVHIATSNPVGSRVQAWDLGFGLEAFYPRSHETETLNPKPYKP